MFDEKPKTFELIVPAHLLKKYFIEYRTIKSNDINEWYIVPKEDFTYYDNITNYYRSSGTSHDKERILKEKSNSDDIIVTDVILKIFNETFKFEFETEEEALYFKMKYDI